MISSKLTWQAQKRNDLTGQADTHRPWLNRLRPDGMDFGNDDIGAENSLIHLPGKRTRVAL